MPECPSPHLGQNILHRLTPKISLGGALISSPLQMLLLSEKPKILCNSETWETHINPIVWDQGIPGWAKIAVPVVIHLKDPSHFPNQKWFPLRPEVKQDLQPIYNI